MNQQRRGICACSRPSGRLPRVLVPDRELAPAAASERHREHAAPARAPAPHSAARSRRAVTARPARPTPAASSPVRACAARVSADATADATPQSTWRDRNCQRPRHRGRRWRASNRVRAAALIDGAASAARAGRRRRSTSSAIAPAPRARRAIRPGVGRRDRATDACRPARRTAPTSNQGRTARR